MRRLLNYLLGEEAVNEQNGREIKEAFAGVAMCIAFTAMCLFAMYVFE